MVYPLFAVGTKTEGDKTKASARGGSADSVGFNSGSASRSGCCLYDSNEELLDFELGSNLHPPTTTNSTFTLNQQHQQQHQQQQRTTCTLENGFSIDSRDKYYSHEVPGEEKSLHNGLRWSRFLKALKRRLKMGLRRYYLLLVCLILVIVSCMIASFAISRSVGELDADDSSSSKRSSGSSNGNNDATGSKALGLSSPEKEEFEQRAIDLIDLIQCGKTFAFTRIRIQVKVPKNVQDYKQQPSFLQPPISRPQISSNNQPTSGQSNEGPHLIHSQEQRPVRFILTTPRDTSTVLESDGLETGASERLPEGTNNGNTITSTSSANPLAIDIKPVTLPAVVARRAAVTAPPITELTVLLAASSRNSKRDGTGDTSDLSSPSQLLELTGDSQTPDPMEVAASELRVSPATVNRTLVDCFAIDIDKRYWQKVAFEDKYRQVASTRNVPFTKMMQTLIECRQLTWSSLPPMIKPKETIQSNLSDQQPPPLVAAASGEQQEPSQQPPSGTDLIGAMFSSWLHNSNNNNNNDDNNDDSSSSSQAPSLVAPAEARQRPQTVSLDGVQSGSEDDKRQGSYLTMGISMVSGIVPNTLWCGLGDRAANYSELGAEYQVDSCCRAHDHCPIRLKPFSADYGLVNWSVSTRSHCDCDIDFSNCLNSANSTLANVIRVLYFRFVGLQCIDVEGRAFSRQGVV